MKFGILDSFCETDIERRMLEGHELIVLECRHEDELPDSIADLDACMLWHYVSIGEKTLGRLKNCKAIIRIGTGYDSVDYIAAGKRGIPVFNIPDYGTNDVADHTMALFLASCRSLVKYSDGIKADIKANWDLEIGGDIRRITGATFGIVGLGRIGGAVAQRAKAFGLDVVFYDPYKPDGYDKTFMIKRVGTLEKLFETCDYVSIHCPLTDETKSMINTDLFDRAKDGFTLINTARGGIVSLDDVYNALKTDKMRAFAADVLETEPPDEKHLLVQAFVRGDTQITDKVIITPHAAFYATESRIEMREKAARLLRDLANGVPMRNCVNKEWLINPKVPVF